MKANIKILLTLAGLAFALLFASCTRQEEFKPGEKVDGAQVYFPAGIQTEYSIGEETTSITVEVQRLVKTGALTVPVLVDASALEEMEASELFSFPDAVEFKDGEDKAEFTVTFERSELVDGEEYNFSLLLNDEKNVTPYGNRTIALSVSPWPWVYLGEGKYRDVLIADLYGTDNVEISCDIHKHKSTEGLYMLENLFGYNLLTEAFGVTEAELSAQFPYVPTNIIINCTNPDGVFFSKQFTGITETSEKLGRFNIGTFEAGTLVNGVITFPKEGLAVELEGLGRTLPINSNGMFRILLPGAEVVDYDIAATYTGMRVNPDNTVASAVIDFTYGADVTGISYAFVGGDVTADPSEAVKGIVDGTAENIYTVDNIQVGGGTASIEAELEAGSYTVVAVPMDKDGKPLGENAAATWFYFYGIGGSNVPDCDMEVIAMNVSQFNPALLEQYPEHSSFIYVISGSEIKSAKVYVNKTAVIESIPSMELTEEDVINEYGSALDDNLINALNTNGKVALPSYNLSAETSYTVLVLATNEYGKSVIKRASITTAQVPYSGELVVGNYAMSCSYDIEYEGETYSYTDKTVFKLSPIVDSEELFLVSNLMDGDDMRWYAKYDSVAKTLTLDGTSPDFKDETKNMFGLGFYVSDTEAMEYDMYLDPGQELKNSPLEFGVNDDKELSTLNTNVQVAYFYAETGKLIDLVNYYVGKTAITYDVPETEGGTAKASCSSIAKTLKKMSKGFISNSPVARKRNLLKSAASAGIVRPAGGVATVSTLKVRTSSCEPLAREFPCRIKADSAF